MPIANLNAPDLNGKEYIRSPLSFSEGSPYFLAAEASAGTILYDHVFYDDVHLLYDELQNDLVYVDESHQIMLLNEKVARFSILGNQFIQLRQDSGNHLTGYFQLLYEGNCLALKKEEKKIRVLNSFSGNEMTRIIDTRSDYYLKKGDDYFKIEGKKTFFELWGNYQKEIKGFIKSNKLKFNKELDIDYARLTAFCDRLSPVK